MSNVNFKFLVTLLVMSSSLIFTTGCDKEEEIDPANIVGLWNASDSSLDMTVDGVSFVDYIIDELGMSQLEAEAMKVAMEEESTFSGTIEFKDDGTYTANWEGEDPESGTWEISEDGKTLTVTAVGEDPMIFTVTKLTSSTCTITMEESFNEDMNQDGTKEEINMSSTLTFTR